MAVKTRAELKADIDAVLSNPTFHDVTPEMIRSILTDISDSMFVAADDYTYPASVETLNVASATSGITVDGQKVVGGQWEAISDDDGSSLANLKDTVNNILAALRGHGLIYSE